MSEGWVVRPLGPRILELPKSALPAGAAHRQGSYPFYCSSPEVKRIDRALTSTRSILMGTGGVATVHLGSGPFAYSTDTWAFTASDETTDVSFLYRQLEHRLSEIDYAGFGGSGLRHLQKHYIRSLQLPCPPKREQIAISGIIDTLDTTICQTEEIIAKLKQIKQGLLHDLLTRGIDANGELRPPQSQAPQLYKTSPLGWIPREWHVQPLANFMAADITYGIVQAGPHIDGGVPYIRTGDMSGTRLDRATLLCTSRRIADNYRRSEVRAGDLVMAIRATVGKVLPVPCDLDGANLTQGTARLAPNLGADAGFLLWAIRHQRAQDSILAEIKGTTFAEITLAALRGVPLAAPVDLAEQRLIGERVEACEARIRKEDLQRQKLQTLKSGLMDNLLTGRVRVTPLLQPEVGP